VGAFIVTRQGDERAIPAAAVGIILNVLSTDGAVGRHRSRMNALCLGVTGPTNFYATTAANCERRDCRILNIRTRMPVEVIPDSRAISSAE